MENPRGFETVITCPYNVSHQILPNRMQTHLAKCSKQYPEIILDICPFNVVHRLKKADMKKHKETCPDRHNFDHYINVMDEDQNGVSKVEVKPPKHNTNPFLNSKPDESWDHFDAPGYDPQAVVKEKPVLRNTDGMTPAQRRNFSIEEHRRLTNMKHF